MHGIRYHSVYLIILLLLSACATSPAPPRACANAHFQIDAQFDAGNFYACHINGAESVHIALHPEDEQINPSPWYAFRIASLDATALSMTLDFGSFPARYWPKISHDGHHWQALPEEAVRIADDGRSMTITLADVPALAFIAAQEVLATDYYQRWISELAAHNDLTLEVLGSSVEGRPIVALASEPRAEAVVLLGRQHPPEVTGALGMRPFVDAILADNELASQFRARYMLLIAPLVNPDGVARGHWRHNVSGVDLNRDWGPFTQPETQSLATRLGMLEAGGTMPSLMLDFHSTRESLFYTQLPEDFGSRPDFATTWLEQARARLPDYPFKHDARAVSEQANSKNYFFGRYGIPAITYELGDEVDREAIQSSSVVFAEEMMRVLLAVPRRH